jgi:hypothetical protein
MQTHSSFSSKACGNFCAFLHPVAGLVRSTRSSAGVPCESRASACHRAVDRPGSGRETRAAVADGATAHDKGADPMKVMRHLDERGISVRPGDLAALPLLGHFGVTRACTRRATSVKSLMAASLFNKAAMQRGVPCRAIARGVSPDASVPSPIAAALGQDDPTQGSLSCTACDTHRCSGRPVVRGHAASAIERSLTAIRGKERYNW